MKRRPRIKLFGRKYSADLLAKTFHVTKKTARTWIKKGSRYTKERRSVKRTIVTEPLLKRWSMRAVVTWADAHGYRVKNEKPTGTYLELEDIPDTPLPVIIYVNVKLIYSGNNVQYATMTRKTQKGRPPQISGYAADTVAVWEDLINGVYERWEDDRATPYPVYLYARIPG